MMMEQSDDWKLSTEEMTILRRALHAYSFDCRRTMAQTSEYPRDNLRVLDEQVKRELVEIEAVLSKLSQFNTATLER